MIKQIVSFTFVQLLILLFKIQNYLIEYLQMQSNVQLQECFCCTICYEEYNQDERKPIFVCSSHHVMCKICFEAVLAKAEGQRLCPSCKTQLFKDRFVQFTFLHEVKTAVFSYRYQTKQIKQQLQRLKLLEEEFNKILNIQHQKYSRLVRHINERKEQYNCLQQQSNYWKKQCEKWRQLSKTKDEQIQSLNYIIKQFSQGNKIDKTIVKQIRQKSNYKQNQQSYNVQNEVFKLRVPQFKNTHSNRPTSRNSYKSQSGQNSPKSNPEHIRPINRSERSVSASLKPTNFIYDPKRFLVEHSHYKILITYIAEYQSYTSYTFRKGDQIPKRGITKYRIKQTKTKNRYVHTGIATGSIEKDGYLSKDYVTYFSGMGSLWQNGNERRAGSSISDGQIIQIEINPIKWEVKWSANGFLLASTIIPSHMRNHSLYLVIIMSNENDVVELELN